MHFLFFCKTLQVHKFEVADFKNENKFLQFQLKFNQVSQFFIMFWKNITLMGLFQI